MAIQTLIRHFRQNPDGSLVFDVRVLYDDVAMALTAVSFVNNTAFPLLVRVQWQAQSRSFNIPVGTQEIALPGVLRRPVTIIDGDVGVDGLQTDVAVRYS